MKIRNFEEWLTEDEKDQPISLNHLKNTARKVKHCGDYGNLYINYDTGDIFWTAADSDSSENGYTDSDDIEKMFLKVKGVKSVRVEGEASPNDDDGFNEIKY